jgi:hypothetical protein
MAADPVALEEIIIGLPAVVALGVTPEPEALDQLVLVVTDPQGQEAGLAAVGVEIFLALRHLLGNELVV